MTKRQPATPECRWQELQEQLQAMTTRPQVALTGSLTLDIACHVGEQSADRGSGDSHDSTIGKPVLGGSLSWTWRAFRHIDRERRYDVRAYGPKPRRQARTDPAAVDRWWKNEQFLNLLDEQDRQANRGAGLAAELTETDWVVPVSLQVLLPGGHRQSFQENDTLSERFWKKCFKDLARDKPRVLYFGAAWRGSSPIRGLALKEFAGGQSVVALHAGTFRGQNHPALREIREALPSVHILFSHPSTLRMILEHESAPLVPTRRSCDYLALPQIARLPPLTVLYRGYHEIELVVPHLQEVYHLQPPQLAAAQPPAPVGLRSCFVGCFLYHLLNSLRARRDKNADERTLREMLLGALSRSANDSLHFRMPPQPADPPYDPQPVVHTIARHSYMVGSSRQTKTLCEEIEQVAPTRVPVLITGKSGTGKELVAEKIHALSQVWEYPCEAVNCAALPETLADSELFGHVKGAFTGAERDHAGAFQRADGGTLFLDEIGLMPLATQGKLLRALEKNEIIPVGGTQRQSVNVRLICATDQDLDQAVREGKFLESLFHRINAYRIDVCPLSERKEDIRPLVGHFAGDCPEKYGISEPVFAEAAVQELEDHVWHGNVRELKNVVLRCAIAAQSADGLGKEVSAEDVQRAFGPARHDPGAPRQMPSGEEPGTWLQLAVPLLDAAGICATECDHMSAEALRLAAWLSAHPACRESAQYLRSKFGAGAVHALKARGILVSMNSKGSSKGGRGSKVVLAQPLRARLEQLPQGSLTQAPSPQ